MRGVINMAKVSIKGILFCSDCGKEIYRCDYCGNIFMGGNKIVCDRLKHYDPACFKKLLKLKESKKSKQEEKIHEAREDETKN